MHRRILISKFIICTVAFKKKENIKSISIAYNVFLASRNCWAKSNL